MHRIRRNQSCLLCKSVPTQHINILGDTRNIPGLLNDTLNISSTQFTSNILCTYCYDTLVCINEHDKLKADILNKFNSPSQHFKSGSSYLQNRGIQQNEVKTLRVRSSSENDLWDDTSKSKNQTGLLDGVPKTPCLRLHTIQNFRYCKTVEKSDKSLGASSTGETSALATTRQTSKMKGDCSLPEAGNRSMKVRATKSIKFKKPRFGILTRIKRPSLKCRPKIERVSYKLLKNKHNSSSSNAGSSKDDSYSSESTTTNESAVETELSKGEYIPAITDIQEKRGQQSEPNFAANSSTARAFPFYQGRKPDRKYIDITTLQPYCTARRRSSESNTKKQLSLIQTGAIRSASEKTEDLFSAVFHQESKDCEERVTQTKDKMWQNQLEKSLLFSPTSKRGMADLEKYSRAFSMKKKQNKSVDISEETNSIRSKFTKIKTVDAFTDKQTLPINQIPETSDNKGDERILFPRLELAPNLQVSKPEDIMDGRVNVEASNTGFMPSSRQVITSKENITETNLSNLISSKVTNTSAGKEINIVIKENTTIKEDCVNSSEPEENISQVDETLKATKDGNSEKLTNNQSTMESFTKEVAPYKLDGSSRVVKNLTPVYDRFCDVNDQKEMNVYGEKHHQEVEDEDPLVGLENYLTQPREESVSQLFGENTMNDILQDMSPSVLPDDCKSNFLPKDSLKLKINSSFSRSPLVKVKDSKSSDTNTFNSPSGSQQDISGEKRLSVAVITNEQKSNDSYAKFIEQKKRTERYRPLILRKGVATKNVKERGNSSTDDKRLLENSLEPNEVARNMDEKKMHEASEILNKHARRVSELEKNPRIVQTGIRNKRKSLDRGKESSLIDSIQQKENVPSAGSPNVQVINSRARRPAKDLLDSIMNEVFADELYDNETDCLVNSVGSNENAIADQKAGAGNTKEILGEVTLSTQNTQIEDESFETSVENIRREKGEFYNSRLFNANKKNFKRRTFRSKYTRLKNSKAISQYPIKINLSSNFLRLKSQNKKNSKNECLSFILSPYFQSGQIKPADDEASQFRVFRRMICATKPNLLQDYLEVEKVECSKEDLFIIRNSQNVRQTEGLEPVIIQNIESHINNTEPSKGNCEEGISSAVNVDGSKNFLDVSETSGNKDNIFEALESASVVNSQYDEDILNFKIPFEINLDKQDYGGDGNIDTTNINSTGQPINENLQETVNTTIMKSESPKQCARVKPYDRNKRKKRVAETDFAYPGSSKADDSSYPMLAENDADEVDRFFNFEEMGEGDYNVTNDVVDKLLPDDFGVENLLPDDFGVEHFISDDLDDENFLAGDHDVENLLPGDIGVENMLPGDHGVENMLPGENGVENMLPGDNGVENILPGDNGVEHMLPGDNGVEHMLPGDNGVENMLPGDGAGNMLPGDGAGNVLPDENETDEFESVTVTHANLQLGFSLLEELENQNIMDLV